MLYTALGCPLAQSYNRVCMHSYILFTLLAGLVCLIAFRHSFGLAALFWNVGIRERKKGEEVANICIMAMYNKVPAYVYVYEYIFFQCSAHIVCVQVYWCMRCHTSMKRPYDFESRFVSEVYVQNGRSCILLT